MPRIGVLFELQFAETQPGENICVVGSIPELGSWSIREAQPGDNGSTSRYDIGAWNVRDFPGSPQRLRTIALVYPWWVMLRPIWIEVSGKEGHTSGNVCFDYKYVKERNFRGKSSWEDSISNRRIELPVKDGTVWRITDCKFDCSARSASVACITLKDVDENSGRFDPEHLSRHWFYAAPNYLLSPRILPKEAQDFEYSIEREFDALSNDRLQLPGTKRRNGGNRSASASPSLELRPSKPGLSCKVPPADFKTVAAALVKERRASRSNVTATCSKCCPPIPSKASLEEFQGTPKDLQQEELEGTPQKHQQDTLQVTSLETPQHLLLEPLVEKQDEENAEGPMASLEPFSDAPEVLQQHDLTRTPQSMQQDNLQETCLETPSHMLLESFGDEPDKIPQNVLRTPSPETPQRTVQEKREKVLLEPPQDSDEASRSAPKEPQREENVPTPRRGPQITLQKFPSEVSQIKFPTPLPIPHKKSLDDEEIGNDQLTSDSNWIEEADDEQKTLRSEPTSADVDSSATEVEVTPDTEATLWTKIARLQRENAELRIAMMNMDGMEGRMSPASELPGTTRELGRILARRRREVDEKAVHYTKEVVGGCVKSVQPRVPSQPGNVATIVGNQSPSSSAGQEPQEEPQIG